MATAYVLEFPGATADQYDQVLERMDLGGRVPGGALFHWVTLTDKGMMVVDVWESPEVFQKFSAEKIAPYSAEVGLAPPVVKEYEVYNYLA